MKKNIFLHCDRLEEFSYPETCPFNISRAGKVYKTIKSMGLIGGSDRLVVSPVSVSRAVLEKLDVELKDFRQFNCCGYPMRNADEKAFLLSAAKNIALAEKAGLDILTLCKCCFGSLKAADHLLKEDHEKRKETAQEI